MSRVKVDVQIKDNSKEFVAKVKRLSPVALQKACILVQNSGRGRVRIDTGYLRDSIQYKIFDGSGELEVKAPEENAALIGTITVYAAHIEYTVEPFMRPAIYDNRKAIMQIIADELSKATK